MPALAALSSPFSNIDDIAEKGGFDQLDGVRSARAVKIAILDNGFRGYKAELGKTLPTSTVFREGPVKVDPKEEDQHGLFMAQLLSGLLGKTPGISYKLHLFSAFGYSNLEAAVEKVIAEKFDVVLYAQVWEYGGNGDGKGFINTLVSQATSAGITWINAAGNFGDATHRAQIESNEDGWAKLPGPNNSVRVRCVKSSAKKCQLRVVLSWNDFKNEVGEGTDKDLDLIVTDDALKIVKTSALQQKKSFPEGAPGMTLYPREIVQAEVDPGIYLIRVKDRSKNFDVESDEMRITVSGDHVHLNDPLADDTLLAPADNKSVITVGASDSEKSGFSKSGKKPDLVFPSLVELENGEQYKGSSNSSAVVAAAVAIVKSVKGKALSNKQLVGLLNAGHTGGSVGGTGRGLPLEVVKFQSLARGCFPILRLPYLPNVVRELMMKGAVAVSTDAGAKIFTAEDPFNMFQGYSRVDQDDMLVVSDSGIQVLPRPLQVSLTPGSFEVVQVPRGQRVCSTPGVPAPAPGKGGPMMKLPSSLQ
jgi:hypothetical protein